MIDRRAVFVWLLAFACGGAAAEPDWLRLSGVSGKPGGALVYAQRTPPRTLNPVLATDSGSREVFQTLHADLIHINRYTRQTEPALARSWTVSADGRHYTLELRRGVSFSDGHPFDADDVLFSFQVYLDEKAGSPQRDLLLIDGRPIAVRKLDSHRVAFDLPASYGAGERLFDGFSILPRHQLEQIYREGKLSEAWSLRAAAGIAGLGPFRFKEYVAGQRVVVERNPHYWKTDGAGYRLPYLDELLFVPAGSEDTQVLRLQAGEADLVNRLSARNFALLEKDATRRGEVLADAGPGLEFSFLFFNLNDIPPGGPAGVAARQAYFRLLPFRQAVSRAIDRDAIVRLVYLGRATALSSPVPAGDTAWLDRTLPPPRRSVDDARRLLSAAGFSWSRDGALLGPDGRPVEFTIATGAGNSERVQMATLIQDDLKVLGLTVHIVPLELTSLLTRVTQTRDYDACLLSMSEPDADPNTTLAVWLSSAANHFWRPSQKMPATPWEARIDELMRRQVAARGFEERKRSFDTVQRIAMENLPLIPLVTPHILAAARRNLGNWRTAVMDHYVLWNVDQLYWRADTSRPNGGP